MWHFMAACAAYWTPLASWVVAMRPNGGCGQRRRLKFPSARQRTPKAIMTHFDKFNT